MKSLVAFFFIKLIFFANPVSAQQTTINGPAGSGQFGFSITVLTNGNFVVTDPAFDDGAIPDVGAAYLYNGTTYALISTLKGSSPNDSIGGNGVLALGNGNFVVISTKWDNGAATNAGAVTFGNGITGVSGVVSSSNSLVGSSINDNVGSGGVLDPIVMGVFRTGNYIVRSPLWDNGAATNAGAITWGNANTGVSGVLSSGNSLVGSSANDNVGAININSFGVNSSSLILRSPDWDNGAAANAGAITWFNGLTGITGAISSSNSLVGTTANDKVGTTAATILSNGNYVVKNPDWDNGAIADAGAVTWGNGTTGITGAISSANSLVGGTTGNNVGSGSITILNNGNYVVTSPLWDNGAATDAGAATWGNGASGVTGVVSSSNSLVGTTTNDKVGNVGVAVLANNNYVVRSPYWHNGVVSNAGAVTWGNGATGIAGPVSSANSLVGVLNDDRVGNDDGTITTLGNGNYVIRSPLWDNGATANVGAATWANGTTGITGTINSSNSLIGSSANDFVSIDGITALTNNNYIVRSTDWSDGVVANAGAVTWGNGSTGISGTINSSNSIIGSAAGDDVGTLAWALENGHYVIGSPYWSNGGISDAGAVTWGNGNTGSSGVVSSSNSLVGSSVNDNVGLSISTLGNNNYLAITFTWDNGAATNAGAVTWCNGSGPVTGVISSANSIVGSSTNDNIGSNLSISLGAGFFAVNSPNWDNGTNTDAGAVTIGNSSTGIAGAVSSSISLVGDHTNDRVGSGGSIIVNNSFAVLSPLWDNGSVTDAGAVTWINGLTGSGGIVSSSNSLVGSTNGDNVGNNVILTNFLTNLNYIVRSSNWDNGTTVNAGAVTFGNGSTGVTGTITTCNSVPGLLASGGSTLVSAYNNIYEYMLVGKRQENLVVVFNPSGMTCGINHDSVSVRINGTNRLHFITNSGCRIIASIMPNGSTPVADTVSAKLWIEPSVPEYNYYPFVARHYEILPQVNTTTATAKVTLYFLQQEFNDFNAVSVLKLPNDPSDVAGKSNLRIVKYNGTSSDGSGMPYTNSGNTAFIDPPDSSIVWNAGLNRWEVTTDVTGLGGFIVCTSNILGFNLCPSTTNTISTDVAGTSYQWQVNAGSGYTDLSNGGFYNGTTTPILSIASLPPNNYGNKYRCVVNNVPGTEYEVKFEAVWMGSTNTDWFAGNNWSGCGNVPDLFTDVVVPGGRVNYPFINSNTVVNSLRAEPGATVTIQSGINFTIRR